MFFFYRLWWSVTLVMKFSRTFKAKYIEGLVYGIGTALEVFLFDLACFFFFLRNAALDVEPVYTFRGHR